MYSKNIDYLPRLDQLRFLAALLVFGFHLYHYYYGNWNPHPEIAHLALISEGYTGISLFFSLSGFIFMTIALSARSINYWHFIRNRFLRIFPLFLVIFFIAISLDRDNFNANDVFYIFFSNLGQAPTSNTFITGAAWTISVEFSFYLIFPFLAYFTKQQGSAYLLRLVLLLILVKIAATTLSSNPTHMLYSTLIGRMDQFLWGMLAAWLYHHQRQKIKKYAWPLLALALLFIWLLLYYQAKNASYFLTENSNAFFWVFSLSAEAILWSSVIIGYLGLSFPQTSQQIQKIAATLSRWLCHAGQTSYSFYLWHGMILYLLHQYLGSVNLFSDFSLNFLLNYSITLMATLLFAHLSFITIEKPFLMLRKQYTTGHSHRMMK